MKVIREMIVKEFLQIRRDKRMLPIVILAPIIQTIKQSRQIMRDVLATKDVRVIMGDGYYAFIDLTKYIQNGKTPDGKSFTDSADLCAYLGAEFGVWEESRERIRAAARGA